jgi:hypothetical protein
VLRWRLTFPGSPGRLNRILSKSTYITIGS